MNRLRVVDVVLTSFLAICLALWMRDRREFRENHRLMTQEIADLRSQMLAQNQSSSGLSSRLEDLEWKTYALQAGLTNSGVTSTAAMELLLARRLNEFAEQQSNALARIRYSADSSVTETESQRTQRIAAAVNVLESRMAEQNEKLTEADEKLEQLRIALAVPDDIAAGDVDKAADDPRLENYRAYFQAKRTRDELRAFGRVLGVKLAAEKVELALPRSQ